MMAKLDVDYLLQVAAFLARTVQAVQHGGHRRRALAARAGYLPPVGAARGTVHCLMYLELLRHSSLVVHLELLFGSRKLNDSRSWRTTSSWA